MCMPMPLPVVSRSHSSHVQQSAAATAAAATDGAFVPRTYAYPHPQAPRPSCAASAFSVTMPCALAWKEKTGKLIPHDTARSDSLTAALQRHVSHVTVFELKLFAFSFVCFRTWHWIFIGHQRQCHEGGEGQSGKFVGHMWKTHLYPLQSGGYDGLEIDISCPVW